MIRQLAEREPQRCRQFQLGSLTNMIQERFTDVIDNATVVDALKYLWRTGQVAMTKPDYYRLHALGYTGCESDDFFYRYNFNVVAC